jgi:hypothetical protein
MPRPWADKAVMVGRGAAGEPSTIARGAAGTVLTQVTADVDPVFAAPSVAAPTGVLPVANGGTGNAVGPIAIMQFSGTAVAAGSTVFLGRDDDTTELSVTYLSPVTGTVTAIRRCRVERRR